MKIVLVFLLFLITLNVFGDSGGPLSTEFDKDSLWDSHGPVSVKDINLALRSSDATEQKLAHLYIYGVLDATEGTQWCNNPIEPIGPGGAV